jgi:hypothetical protein
MCSAMPSRRALVLLVAAALAVAACASPLLNAPSPGTVHARVISGSGGSRLLIVPVYIAQHGPYDFALDTGAARSLVDSGIVSDLHLRTVGREQAVTGVSGTGLATRVDVMNWRVDSVALPDATILSLKLPSGSGPALSGLLGSDMLSRFRTVTIDYSSGDVTLH